MIKYKKICRTHKLNAVYRGIRFEECFELDEAIAATERKNLMILVQMANTYAVAAADRALYTSLLTEVRDAGDILPEGRLSNRIAKRRAERYLRLIDQRFP